MEVPEESAAEAALRAAEAVFTLLWRPTFEAALEAAELAAEAAEVGVDCEGS